MPKKSEIPKKFETLNGKKTGNLIFGRLIVKLSSLRLKEHSFYIGPAQTT